MAAPSGSLWWRDNGFGVSFLIKAQKKIHLWSQFYFAILLPWTECVTETDLVGIWEQEKTVSVGVWCTTEAPGHEFVSLCDVVLILRWQESWESKLLNYVWWKHTLTLRHEPFCVVVLLFGELVGRPAGTKLQQVLKWKQIEAVWCMYISSSTGRKSKLCWERLIFFMLTLPICGTWTPHGARLWHCWYLIDVREKKGHRRNIITSIMIMGFFQPAAQRPWQENQEGNLSWARNHENWTWVEWHEVSLSAASLIGHLTHSWACSWNSWSALSSFAYHECVRDQNIHEAEPAGDLKAGRS